MYTSLKILIFSFSDHLIVCVEKDTIKRNFETFFPLITCLF